MGRKKQVERQAGKGAKAVAKPGAGGLEPKRYSTPEDRRAAVEAFEKAGLTQATFARQWGVSPITTFSTYIRTSWVFDKNDRLTKHKDDATNETTWAYREY